MSEFIIEKGKLMQISDYILLALIAFAAALAVRRIFRDRRAGKCRGSCAGCAANCNAARTMHSDAACAARRAQNTNSRAG